MTPSRTLQGRPCRIWLNVTWQAIPSRRQFVADRLMEQGIPAIADKFACNVMGGDGAKVRVRQDDLLRALGWLKAYENRCRSRRDDLD